MGFPGGSVVNTPASAGDTGDVDLIPGLGRYPGGGNGNPLQYSCWENLMDGGVWWATVCGVAELDMTEATQQYSTGSYIQYLIITYNGKDSEKEDTYIDVEITESLCCILESNTTL